MKKISMKNFFLVLFITMFYVLSNITTSFGASTTLASKDFRNMYKINQVDPSKVSTVYKAKRNINGEKLTPQGFCIAKGYFVYILYNNNSKSKNYKQTYLRFISIAEKKYKKQINLGKYGHINDITYNPSTKKVIIPVDNKEKYLFVDVSSSNPKNFKKVDSLTINNGIHSYGIAYCSKYNNYIIANIYNIYYTKKQSLTKVKTNGKHELDNSETMSGLGRQGIACHGNRWYYTKWTEKDKKYTYKNSVFNAYKNSNFIVEYDYNYNVKQNIYIPRAVIEGEIEGVDFYKNQMYGLFIKGNNLVILKIDYSTGFKGNYYYYTKTEANHFKGQKATGWAIINGNSYYFGKNGKFQKWNTINGFKYYFGDNGVMRTGFQTINNKYYYFYESSDGKKHYNGTLASKGWLNIDGRTFYIGSNGEVYTGDREINGRVYVFSKENKNGLLKGEMYLMQVE